MARTSTRKPSLRGTSFDPVTSIKVDFAISPGSLQTALERIAQVGEVPVANINLKLLSVDVDAIRFESTDGAFELTLQLDGRWRCIYHAIIKGAA